MVTLAPSPTPTRPCDNGHRDAWTRVPHGGWTRAACVGLPAPPVDDFGLPLLARHVCDHLGCNLAAGDAEPAPAPFAAAATLTVQGPTLVKCACGRWARVLLVAADGALACAACARVAKDALDAPGP